MFKRGRLKVLYLGIIILIFLLNNANADIFQAGQYLESAQNFDGSWGTDPATIYFETTEAVKTLFSLGRTGDPYQRGVNFVANYEIGGVEDYARTVESIFPSGMDVSDDINKILAAQNTDGGFGFDTDYDSDVYHTALALIALKAAGISDPGIISPAISYLISQQKADGSFGLSADHDSIYLTSLVALALFEFSDTYSLDPQLNDANDWLISKQNVDGGFGENSSTVFETSYALMAMLNVDPTYSGLQDALDYLNANQNPDGSFLGEVYSTAVGAQALDSSLNDRDGDGVPDMGDNCFLVSNPDQKDYEDDGLGDVCDCLGDLDGDGDVDGYDLALNIEGGILISVEGFAMNFSNIYCEN